MKNPENLDDLLSGSTETWNEMFEWGQNKFLGIPDNSTQVELKKSARQIYAEAFMEDEHAFGMSGKRIYDETDYSVDPKAKAQEQEDALEQEEVAIDLDPSK